MLDVTGLYARAEMLRNAAGKAPPELSALLVKLAAQLDDQASRLEDRAGRQAGVPPAPPRQ
jgi:hypothetical protein